MTLQFKNDYETLRTAFLAKYPVGTFSNSHIVGSVAVQFGGGGKVYHYQKHTLASKLGMAL